MTNTKDNETIPNWMTHAVSFIIIDIQEMREADEVYYNPILTMFLENGLSTEDQAVTLITDIYHECSLDAAHMAAESLLGLFDHKCIASKVTVRDYDGNELKEFDLNDEKEKSKTQGKLEA